MLCIAAALFFRTGHTGVNTIQGVHPGIGTAVGGGAALAFAIALLASGLSSSSVGTYAGQVVMQGFIGRRIPLFVRRAVTMAPALIVTRHRALDRPGARALAGGALVRDPLRADPMILVTAGATSWGLREPPNLTTVAGVIAAIIVSLNFFLLEQTVVG